MPYRSAVWLRLTVRHLLFFLPARRLSLQAGRRLVWGATRSGKPDLTALRQADGIYSRDIWIEEEDEYTGKPVIWYSFDSKGRKQKHVRDSLGVSISRDDASQAPGN